MAMEPEARFATAALVVAVAGPLDVADAEPVLDAVGEAVVYESTTEELAVGFEDAVERVVAL